MARGPKGERRPANVIGCSVTVAKIATGEIEDTRLTQPAKRKSGLAGAEVFANKLTAKEWSAIARVAASARWD